MPVEPHVDPVEFVTRYGHCETMFGAVSLLLRDHGIGHLETRAFKASCPKRHAFKALLAYGSEVSGRSEDHSGRDKYLSHHCKAVFHAGTCPSAS
jgi:hypothetical protein